MAEASSGARMFREPSPEAEIAPAAFAGRVRNLLVRPLSLIAPGARNALTLRALWLSAAPRWEWIISRRRQVGSSFAALMSRLSRAATWSRIAHQAARRDSTMPATSGRPWRQWCPRDDRGSRRDLRRCQHGRAGRHASGCVTALAASEWTRQPAACQRRSR